LELCAEEEDIVHSFFFSHSLDIQRQNTKRKTIGPLICIYGFIYIKLRKLPGQTLICVIYTDKQALFIFFTSLSSSFSGLFPVLGVTLLIEIDPCILQLETSFSAHFLMAAV